MYTDSDRRLQFKAVLHQSNYMPDNAKNAKAMLTVFKSKYKKELSQMAKAFKRSALHKS
jgi:hypothetical protein